MPLKIAQTADDAAFLNSIINHPDVRPFVLFDGQGDFDVTPLLGRCLMLMSDNGGFMFDPVTWPPGDIHSPVRGFHLHTFFLPIGRGEEARNAAWEAAELIFTRTMALEIYTCVPADNPMARPPVSMGFREHFKRPAMITRGGVKVDVGFWRLEMFDWASKARGLIDEGRAFHERLKAMRAAAGQPDERHPDEDAHDRYVGLAGKMARWGKVQKAVGTYNRWAMWSGYQTMRIDGYRESDSRYLINLGDGKIEVSGKGNGEELDFNVYVPKVEEVSTIH